MSKQDTLDDLYKIRKEISKSDHESLISQIDYTIKKVYDDLFVSSFIGHFSAGKSSLINYILEEDVLPSSPIPTTSKTVQIEIGKTHEARVFIDKNHYVYLERLDEVKNINKKDVDIEYVKIIHPSNNFKNKFVFQDTPGVDSKTSTHEESTNHFLLNSDYIFFTVEYNHVESESNLKFLQEVAALNIPYSLIINQIDKHDDKEISYNDFLKRVKNSLNNHQLNPEHIFTTSIYDSPYRQNDKLITFMQSIDKSRESFKLKYHDRIIQNIEEKHAEYLDDQLNDLEIENLSIESLKEKIAHLEDEQNAFASSAITNDKDMLIKHLKNKIKKIVTDSYLFPHHIKELFRDYFKMCTGEISVKGLFGKKKKLEEMKHNQIAEIQIEFQQIIDSEINTQINNLFSDLNLESEKYYKFEFTHDLLTDYEITESNEKFLNVYFDHLKQSISKKIRSEIVSFTDQLSLSKKQSKKDVTNELDNYKTALHLTKLKDMFLSGSYKHLYTHVDDSLKKLNKNIEVSIDSINDMSEDVSETVNYDYSYETLNTDSFKDVLNLISSSQSYQDVYHLIDEKLNRLNNNIANISVFGGFSAGKSTFINALLNKKLLTTSPNPTTASITEISKSDESYILYKSESQLIEILESITNKTRLTLDEQVKQLNKIKSLPKSYIPLLNGLNDNLDTYRDLLGKKEKATIEDIDFKTSVDSHALFIEQAFIGFNNTLLDNFTIIDSPGINSMNQRHTNETYHIIANSDLIIYVAYFNHVFTQSDEQFLKYIQSIKGKEFPITVVINAVDLAKDENEVEDVKNYMHHALNALEIQHKIYGVSSKRALEKADSTFEKVKTEFITNAENQSKQLLSQSINENINQFILLLQSNIKQFEDGESYIEEVNRHRQSMVKTLQRFTVHQLNDSTNREVENLFAYISQQLELKLYDYLSGKISMNEIKQKHLRTNSNEIHQLITHYLTIESNTIVNNIYIFINESLKSIQIDLNEQLKSCHTVDSVQFDYCEVPQIALELEYNVLNDGLKTIEKRVKTHKQLKNELLQLSKIIIESINLGTIKENVKININKYFDQIDEKLVPELNRLTEKLNQPIDKPNESQYEESKLLLSQIKKVR